MIKAVYEHDAGWAREHGELDAWRESRDLNDKCSDDIAQAIRRHFDGMRLDKKAVTEVVDVWGLDRVEYVLAGTLQMRDGDGRFSRNNMAWAKSFLIWPGMYACVAAHSAILDGYVSIVLKMESDRIEMNRAGA